MNIKIPTNILRQYHLPPDLFFQFKLVDPRVLLCPERLDIAAKYFYLDKRETLKDYACKVYAEHIKAMTKNSLVEPYSSKQNLKSFFKNFDLLYQNLSSQGYKAEQVIPVDKDLRIMDGAHRVASCLKLGISVPVIILPIEAKYDIYDQVYFEKQGIDPDILETIMRTYLDLSSKTLCINIWPSAQGHDKELNDLICAYFHVVYRKVFTLNETGALFYLAQIYREYSWAHSQKGDFSGIYRKLIPCFPTYQPVRAIFVEPKTNVSITAIKEQMRSLFNLEKHSLHITDNVKETQQMAEIILNKNSIQFPNMSNIGAFENTFLLVKAAIEKHVKCSPIVFTGSLVLALYGIRPANDVDYIVDDHTDPHSHNELLDLYPLDKTVLLYDENYHFCFFGCHFVILEIIKQFKMKRNEHKDKEDLALIDLVLRKRQSSTLKVQILRFKRRTIAKLQGSIIRMAHRTGTYEVLRKVYQYLKK